VTRSCQLLAAKKRGKILCWIPSSILQEIFVQFGQKISAFDETVFFGFYIILMEQKFNAVPCVILDVLVSTCFCKCQSNQKYGTERILSFKGIKARTYFYEIHCNHDFFSTLLPLPPIPTLHFNLQKPDPVTNGKGDKQVRKLKEREKVRKRENERKSVCVKEEPLLESNVNHFHPCLPPLRPLHRQYVCIHTDSVSIWRESLFSHSLL